MNQSENLTALGSSPADATIAASLSRQALQQYMSQVYMDQARIESESNQDLRRNARASSERPYIPFNSELTLDQLMSYPTATMYGSRALQVSHANSDYDIAFSSESSSIVSRLMAAGIRNTNPTDYFKLGPEGGYCAFFHKVPLGFDRDNPYRKIYADILVVHTDEDLDCISSAINDLRAIPSYLLENRDTRIDLYQKALVHRGWKRLETPSQVFRRGPAGQPGSIHSPFLLQEASEPTPWDRDTWESIH